MKNRLITVGFFLLILATAISWFGRKYWFFRAPIVDRFELVQIPFETTYNIRAGSNVVIEGVFGWVIADKWLIGSCGTDQYFAIERVSGEKRLFSDLRSFNQFITSQGLKRYNMSDEENVSHLKYGGGRNRKYGLK
jgi:hypothetical protein